MNSRPNRTAAEFAQDLIGKFYIWQMNDGRWHASPYINSRDVPISYLDMHGGNTRAEAIAELHAWANEAV